jgi:hypothetical protein
MLHAALWIFAIAFVVENALIVGFFLWAWSADSKRYGHQAIPRDLTTSRGTKVSAP